MTMITDFAPTRLATARRPRFSLGSIVTAFRVMRERARLASMDDRELADIGLTREQATREAARPIWDAPQTWLR